MRNRKIFFATLVIICISSPAYAYLDAGTGSMLLQALIGAISGAFIAGGFYWHKIKTFFRRWLPGAATSDQEISEAKSPD